MLSLTLTSPTTNTTNDYQHHQHHPTTLNPLLAGLKGIATAFSLSPTRHPNVSRAAWHLRCDRQLKKYTRDQGSHYTDKGKRNHKQDNKEISQAKIIASFVFFSPHSFSSVSTFPSSGVCWINVELSLSQKTSHNNRDN